MLYLNPVDFGVDLPLMDRGSNLKPEAFLELPPQTAFDRKGL
jgi:hypothetical protein